MLKLRSSSCNSNIGKTEQTVLGCVVEKILDTSQYLTRYDNMAAAFTA